MIVRDSMVINERQADKQAVRQCRAKKKFHFRADATTAFFPRLLLHRRKSGNLDAQGQVCQIHEQKSINLMSDFDEVCIGRYHNEMFA
jgi:hypothetical protein